MDEIGDGTLKCIVGHSLDRSLCALLEEVLRSNVRAQDIRQVGGDALIAYSDASPADLRDWISPRLEPGESVFVVEFERWSAFGPAADRKWLLRRGH
jgi:hypothetical protein